MDEELMDMLSMLIMIDVMIDATMEDIMTDDCEDSQYANLDSILTM